MPKTNMLISIVVVSIKKFLHLIIKKTVGTINENPHEGNDATISDKNYGKNCY